MLTHITPKSSNEKTGQIPVTTTSGKSCPNSCPLNNANSGGCYAESGPLALHWRKVTEGARGDEYPVFLDKIAKMPDGQLWRHNQAGDLYGDGDKINAGALSALVDANKRKRGFTYTHKPVVGDGKTATDNRRAVKSANAGGFTVNLSANNLADADELSALKIGPVVTILPIDSEENLITPGGRRVVVCPAQTRDGITCATCKLCAVVDRSIIVGFRSHGTSQKKAQRVFFMRAE